LPGARPLRAVLLAVALAMVVAAGPACAAAPASVAAAARQAVAQAAVHGRAAARLEGAVHTLRLRLAAIDRDIATTGARRDDLEAAVRRAEALGTGITGRIPAVRARLAETLASWRRLAGVAAALRRDRPQDPRLGRTIAVLASLGGTVAEAGAALEALGEARRQAMRLKAWNREAVDGLPRRLAALGEDRDRAAAMLAAAIASRTARLRRHEAALRHARWLGDLERAGRLAAARAWTRGPSPAAPELPAHVAVSRLPAPGSTSSLVAAVAIRPGQAARTAPVLLDAASLAGVPPAVLPVGGEVAHAYGDRRAGPLWRGVTVLVHNPGTVRAPRRARVVFASPFGDFGPLLILDHGDGYHTLIAGMDRIDVTVGTEVERGRAVGRLVASPGRPRRLYIELRRHGEPVDPLPWLASRHNGEAGSG